MVYFSTAVEDFKLPHLIHVLPGEGGSSYTHTETVACVCVLTWVLIWVELKHETLVFSAPNYRVCNWVYVHVRGREVGFRLRLNRAKNNQHFSSSEGGTLKGKKRYFCPGVSHSKL